MNDEIIIYGLCRDFMTAMKKNSIEGWAIFKDMISREGYKA